jgi:DNA ligase-1
VVEAHTRNGKKIDAIPHILHSLEEFFEENPYAVLDGELYNHDLRDNFNKITSLVRKQKPVRTKNDTDKSFEKKEKEFAERCEEAKEIIEYWIYDTPTIASRSGTTELVKDMITVDDNVIFYQDDPFIERFNEIIMWFYDRYDYVAVVPTFEAEDKEHLDDYYGKYLDEGFEGQMVRASESGYENKRSKNLLKRKEFIDEEFKVIDIEEGAGNRTGTAKHLVCKNKDGKTFHSNIKGTFDYLEEILKNKKDYIGKLATIKFFQYTPDGIPRFPYAIAFRDYE